MSSNQADIEHRLSLVEGATQTLLYKQDRQLEEIAILKKEMGVQFADAHQTLNLLVEMFKAQQEQLKKMDTRLMSIGHDLELQYRLIEQEIQKREQKG